MIVIIGGGLTGLLAGYELSKKGFKVVVLEKDTTIGGVLGSIKRKDYYIEKFYHHIFPQDKEVVDLLHKLKLKNSIIWKNTKTGFYSHNKIYNLSGALDLLTFNLLSPIEKIKLSLLMLKIKMIKENEIRKYDNIPLTEWIIRNVGENVYNSFFKPMLKSKYGENLEKISAAWFIERMKIRMHRGLKGEKLGYVLGGFKKIIQELCYSIEKRGGEILTNARVKKIYVKNNEVKSLKYNKKIIKVNCIISTVPPSELLKMLKFPHVYEKKLKSLEYQGCISTVLGLKDKLTDFYWTNIIENNEYLGAIIEHTNFISPSFYNNEHIIYLASYPDKNSKVWKKSEKEIFKVYFNELKKLFPKTKVNIKWWKVCMTKYAGLIYKKGIFSKMLDFKTPVNGLFVGGMFNSYPERSINHSIVAGKKCSALVEEYLCSH